MNRLLIALLLLGTGPTIAPIGRTPFEAKTHKDGYLLYVDQSKQAQFIADCKKYKNSPHINRDLFILNKSPLIEGDENSSISSFEVSSDEFEIKTIDGKIFREDSVVIELRRKQMHSKKTFSIQTSSMRNLQIRWKLADLIDDVCNGKTDTTSVRVRFPIKKLDVNDTLNIKIYFAY